MGRRLWTPSPERVEGSEMTRYTRFAEEKTGRRFGSYDELWRWSVEERPAFWETIWQFGEIVTAS